jgi:hypothetical protein
LELKKYSEGWMPSQGISYIAFRIFKLKTGFKSFSTAWAFEKVLKQLSKITQKQGACIKQNAERCGPAFFILLYKN